MSCYGKHIVVNCFSCRPLSDLVKVFLSGRSATDIFFRFQKEEEKFLHLKVWWSWWVIFVQTLNQINPQLSRLVEKKLNFKI